MDELDASSMSLDTFRRKHTREETNRNEIWSSDRRGLDSAGTRLRLKVRRKKTAEDDNNRRHCSALQTFIPAVKFAVQSFVYDIPAIEFRFSKRQYSTLHQRVAMRLEKDLEA